MSELAAFIGISVLVIVTPGQDTALTVRNAMVGGRATGVFTAAGVAAGQATWTIATAVGVGALLVAFEPAFLALRLAGAVYLVFLGVQALRAAIRTSSGESALAVLASRPRLSAPAALRQGVLSNLGNPKMLAFFTSLLPQFASSFFGVLVLGVFFCSMTLVWLSAYAFVVARARAVLRRGSVRRVIEAVTGTVLIALGLRLATEPR